MKITVRLYLLFSLCFFCACKTQRGDLPEIEISKKTIVQGNRVDSFFTDFRLVPLETNSSSIIGEISKLEICDSIILIGDYKQNKLFLFDVDGKFLNDICHVGKGPNEYIHIGDFSVDKENKIIKILDIGGRRLQSYNFRGEHLKEHALDRQVIYSIGYKIELFQGYYIFDRENNVFPKYPEYNITVLDKNLNFVVASGMIPLQLKNLGMPTYRSIDIAENQIYINPSGNDTIYKWNGHDSILPVFVFKPDKRINLKRTSLWNNHSNSIVEFREAIQDEGLLAEINKIFMIDDNLLFEYFSPGQSIGIYNSKQCKTIIVPNPRILDSKILFNVKGKMKNYLIAEIGYKENFLYLNELLKKTKLTQESNPVLCFFRFR
jgi:hypothetical protein